MTTEGGPDRLREIQAAAGRGGKAATLPSFANYVRQNRQNEAFNDWFRKEAERGLRTHR